MDVIVAGSRHINDKEKIKKAMENAPFKIDKLLHGGAKGVDKTAAKITELETFSDIETEEYKANWDAYGDAAGPKRNRAMAKEADALIAVWDGKSSGTRHMIEEALRQNLDTYVKNTRKGETISNQTQITELV